MQTLYSWHCPKCGKKYVNGEEPTFCEEQLSLHAPAHPQASAATGLVAVKCGAPILPLTPPCAASGESGKISDPSNCPGPVPEGSLMATVLSAIRGRAWAHLVFREPEVLEFTLNGKYSTLRVIVNVREELHQVVARAMLAPRVPVARRPAVMEFITRLNWACVIGGFDFDLEEGIVRYRAGIDVEGGVLTEKMVNNLIDTAFCLADLHFDRLIQVTYGGVEPKAAAEAPDPESGDSE